jgi:hypothetical protein
MSSREASADRLLGDLRRRSERGRQALLPNSVGSLLHAAVEGALRSGFEDSVEAARAGTAGVIPPGLAPAYVLSLRHRILAATHVYLTQSARDASWMVMAARIDDDLAGLELLFVGSAGRIEADHLEVPRYRPAAESPSVMARLAAQAQTGRRVLGPAFAGVRLVDISHRTTTFTSA